MFVEPVYDKGNFDDLAGARDIILDELSKRVHRIFPDADTRVKPIMTLLAINTDASKHEKEQISCTVQEMLEEADMWLMSERTVDSLIISGVRIYFPKPGEELPVPLDSLRNFAIKGTVDERCCLLVFMQKNWRVPALPEYEHTGAAIMEAVRQGKRLRR